MQLSPRNTVWMAAAIGSLWHLPASAATIRIAFMTEGESTQHTLQLLSSSGCPKESVTAFQRVVEHYCSTLSDFDLSRFPPKHGGFYEFESAQALVAALPHQLAATRHDYEFNCFDTVILLSAGALRLKLRPDEIAGPFLVPQAINETN